MVREMIPRLLGLMTGIVLAVILILVYLLTPQLGLATVEVYDRNKLIILDQVVGYQYFKQSDYEDRVEGLYSGYVSGLEDSTTMYFTAEEAAKWLAEDKGKYVGTGIKFTWGITNQYLVVTEVLNNSPAEAAGIQVGDRITAIDGVFAMMSNELDIYEKLTSTSDAVYTVIKDGIETDIALFSAEIETDAVNSMLLQNNIGYLELVSLNEGAVEEIYSHIDNLETQGANKWIIDMRYLSNADFQETILLTDLLTDAGPMFLSVDKEGETTEYNSVNEKINGQVVILTNASTSGNVEAVIATVKDDESITTIGTNTKGNAKVQEFIQLSDGSGLLIATENLYTTDEREIGSEPMEPEILVELDVAYTLKLVTEGVSDKELDNQLIAAIEHLS
ncbi:MAG: hypothetical protein ATN34_02250 [Epulopiscium sp. Nele67-Bin002]|nr:MAG: hypothetical protein ATN34_02250 [Epulopiscium sp. Nele67-Bin002]